MDQQPRFPDERHAKARVVLRWVGPVLLALGVVLTAIGFYTVIAGDPFGEPLRAALPFVGMPLMFVGGVMSMYGYMGALARYHAGEITPVAGQAFNRFAEDTRPSLRAMAGAVSEGMRSHPGTRDETRNCPSCGRGNNSDANFCDQCGAAMPAARTCPGCGRNNDPQARYCDGCGRRQ